MTEAISQNRVVYEPTANKPMATTQPVQNPEDIIVPPPNDSDKSSNSLMNTLTGLALIGSAVYIGYNYFRGRGTNAKTLEDFKRAGGTIEKGIAKLKDGSNFTGMITHTNPKTGNSFFRRYVNGKIVRSGKNMDEMGFYNPSSPTNMLKNWEYDAEGKLVKIKHTTIKNGNPIETQRYLRKDILKRADFEAAGGKVVDGQLVYADGSKYNGFLVEYDGHNTLIKEFADGKQISERLNTSLKNRVINNRPESYILDEQGLITREKEILSQKEEAERIAKEQQKLTYKIKNLFKNRFSRPAKPKTETNTTE